MKKEYLREEYGKPVIDVVKFDYSDVIVASAGCNVDSGCYGEDSTPDTNNNSSGGN